jgi:hypothetical protein
MSTTKGHSDGAVHQFYWMKRRLYRTGRPGLIARSLDRIAAVCPPDRDEGPGAG